MTNLPYHTLYQNGQRHELTIQEGPLLLLTTVRTNTPNGIPEHVRTIAFEEKALKGKTIRIGHYPDGTSKTPRINLAEIEPLEKNETAAHMIRITIGKDGNGLIVENTLSKPMSVSKFSLETGINALQPEPFNIGSHRLEPGEKITFEGRSDAMIHELHWTDARDYQAEEALERALWEESKKRQNKQD